MTKSILTGRNLSEHLDKDFHFIFGQSTPKTALIIFHRRLQHHGNLKLNYLENQ